MTDIIYPDLFLDSDSDKPIIYDNDEHAIRNELQVIVGVAELLKRNITNPYYFEYGKKAEDCDRILEAAHRIVDILTKGDTP